LIFISVSHDDQATSYLMRFWDIFSLATGTKKRLASLQRRPDAKSFYSSFLIQSCGSVVPIHYSFSHAFDPLQYPNKKSAPARGGGWSALETPPAKRPGEFAS